MKKAVAILSIFLCAQLVVAQDHTSSDSPAWQQSGASAPAPTSQLQGGSLIYAELSKSIDSKKAKVGDPVVAKVTQAVLSHGKIVIPKNTKIIGHLTAAKARSKEQPQAQLGIVFDRAELKDGSQVPLGSATIQALASAFFLDQPSSTAANGTGGSADISGMPNSRSGANMGGGMGSPPMGGSPYPSNTGSSSADPTSGTGTGAPNTGGQLNAGSRGVSGMPGVRLEPQPQGGMVSVEGKNLKLDSGTQLVLRTQ